MSSFANRSDVFLSLSSDHPRISATKLVIWIPSRGQAPVVSRLWSKWSILRFGPLCGCSIGYLFSHSREVSGSRVFDMLGTSFIRTFAYSCTGRHKLVSLFSLFTAYYSLAPETIDEEKNVVKLTTQKKPPLARVSVCVCVGFLSCNRRKLSIG